MRPSKNELVVRRTTKFSKADVKSSSVFTEINENADSIGGIIRKGQLGWLARGPLLEVFSLRNGNKISSYRFDVTTSSKKCFITCVSEINAPTVNYCLLAVGIQLGDDPGGMISIYSVQESKVLRSIETSEKVTCCHMISDEVAERTVLQMFQGCLAVGTDVGKVILLDLFLRNCEKRLLEAKTSDDDLFLVPCHVVLSNMSNDHIAQHFRHAHQENVGFGIQLEVDNPEIVLSLLTLDPLLSLAVGFEDGRMILYDLSDLQAFHLAYPTEDLSPLVKLCYVEPPDDPRACLYIWAFHENRRSSIAVMHSVMYDRKNIDDDDDDGFYVFEGFQSCSVRLTLPMFERDSLPVSCQSVIKQPTNESEEIISLCLLAWKSKKSAEILIFDINQWYKEQMPHVGDWRDNLSYLVSFPIKDNNLLDVWLDGRTVAPFNSIDRPEEHFFPVSLSFDCTVFQDGEIIKCHWPGLQNRVLSMLNMAGPSAMLEPSVYFHEITKASLAAQNSPDYSFSSSVSINSQRDAILSVALEYNCFGLLKECAKCWADGSHLGRKPDESLSLSTMTNWIWKRAERIKDRCNTLCIPLFDQSGFRIDQRSQIELSYYSRQLKLLAELMNIVLTKCNEYIPEEVNTTLTTQFNSIRMASEYQEVLQWFLNVGLLPEAPARKSTKAYLENAFDSRTPLVPYPYKSLRSFYTSQRMKFKKINSGLLSPRTQSCRILYIDSFIEHECNANILREHWLESGGNGLYPPPSLQAMLRTLLVPDVPAEKKYTLFVYFFLDLNAALEDDSVKYSMIIENFIKFPSVFKINSSDIKIIQAFWNLDHGQFEAALEEIISPFLHDHKLVQWQKELLIEALLVHHDPKLALRALRAPGAPISSLLELKTLLANDMVSEAFHLQRCKNDSDLFKQFLTGCLYLGKMSSLLDLALTEDEDAILEEFLRESKSAKTENLHFVHLLQRSKYIEAIQQLDELSQSKHNQHSVDLETPNLVLAAYNMTMTPATKHLSEVYYGIRNRLRAKEPEEQKMETLSSQLLKCNADDVAGGVYHSSIMGVDEATNYWDEKIHHERKRLLYPCNVPFIRRPQLEAMTSYQGESNLCYPEVYRSTHKRRLDRSDVEDEEVAMAVSEENPTKRHKINESLSGIKTAEPLNATLLTRFKNRQANKSSVNEQTSTPNVNSIRNDKDSSMKCLNTPIIKSSRQVSDSRETSPSESSETNKMDRVGTPQSILKVRTVSGSVSSPFRKAAESTPRGSLSPRELEANEYIDEEKSIRFDIPSANVTATSSLQTSRESLEMSQRVPSTSIASANVEDKVKNEKLKRFGGPSPRKSLRSTDVSLMSTSGDEEFFSPQQSRDNSVRKPDNENSENESESDKEENVTQIIRPPPKQPEIKLSMRAGPQPRKPLERSSRSRSKTPDPTTSPSRKSTRVLEQTKTEFMEIHEVHKTTEAFSQSSSKSLNRFVMMSNIKKASNLTPTESSIFNTGRVLAQSTGILGTNIYSTDSITSDSQRIAEMSTVHLTGPSKTFHPSTLSYGNTRNEEANINEDIVDETKDDLTTTEEISSLDVTAEEISPLKQEDTFELSKVGGRKSYRSTQKYLSEAWQSAERKSIETTARIIKKVEESLTSKVNNEIDRGEESVDAKKGYELNETNEPDDVTAIIEQMEYEVNELDEGALIYEASSEYGNDNGANKDAAGVQIDIKTSEEESSSDSDSESSDVISISSGEETTQTQTITTSSTSKSRSATPVLRGSDKSEGSDYNQDQTNLLYDDLDIQQHSCRSQSISSTDTEIFTAPNASTNDANENIALNSEIEPQNVIAESTYTFMMSASNFDSGIRNAPPSGMSLNVLTGEYENIIDDEDAKGKPLATSTGIIDSEKETQKSVTPNTLMVGSTSVAKEESSDIEMESADAGIMTEDTSSIQMANILPANLPDTHDKPDSFENTVIESLNKNSDTIGTITSAHHKSGENIDTLNDEKPSSPEEFKCSTALLGSEANQEIKRVEKSTDEALLNKSDYENEAVGLASRQGDEKNIKTPVKTAFEIDSASSSGRILRSTRRRSASIDTNTSDTVDIFDSPSVTQRVLRAKSVPRTDSAETPTHSKLRRRSNSTDNPSTPTRVLTRRRSTLLDRIEEGSIYESPRNSIKKRSTAETIVKEAQVTPATMVKRTRKASTSSVDTPELATSRRKAVLSEDNTQTPQRITRRMSVSKDTPKSSSKKEAKEKTAKGHGKKTSTPEGAKSSQEATETDESEILDGSPADMGKVKGSEVRKLFTKASTSKEASIDKSDVDSSSPEISESAAFSSNTRRLTRNQQSVLEKSASVAKKLEAIPKKTTRRRGSKMEDSPSRREEVSETESIISTKSKHSTMSSENRRVTRSSAQKIDDDDDAVSMASSTQSKRSVKGEKKAKSVANKDKSLDAILEEDQENLQKDYSNDESEDDVRSTHSAASKDLTKKKGRPRKAQK